MKQERQANPGRRRWKRWLAALALIGLVLLALMLSRSPAIAVADPPDATQAQAAHAALNAVRGVGRAKRPLVLELTSEQVDQAILLAARAAGVKRVIVERIDRRMWIGASQPLPLGFWLNVQARIEESRQGFPAISVRLGRLPVPAFLCRLGLALGRLAFVVTGSKVPPLDSLVRMVEINPDHTRTQMFLPANSGVFRSVNAVRGTPIDQDEVVRRYCALARHVRADRSPELEGLVRAAFAEAGTAGGNGAAMVAIAMIVVTPQAGLIAGDVPARSRICAPEPVAYTLFGRPDLAKHWALSAALSAVYGEDMSNAIGRFKELADSGAGGSGFSFVDLAADRSGVAYGRRSVDPEKAESVAATLKRAKATDLLPVKALALSEGLSEEAFIRQYQTIESSRYAAMEARIDRILEANLN